MPQRPIRSRRLQRNEIVSLHVEKPVQIATEREPRTRNLQPGARVRGRAQNRVAVGSDHGSRSRFDGVPSVFDVNPAQLIFEFCSGEGRERGAQEQGQCAGISFA